ncbi:MAG TPA: hypothetical protein VE442_16105 [Jatrophihabitans sp.]|jgi:hypothetical protein|nr:hypothetical protein [Jatrophihabitans sp.]
MAVPRRKDVPPAHLELRAEQAARALSGVRPSDAGIRESEPILGAIS